MRSLVGSNREHERSTTAKSDSTSWSATAAESVSRLVDTCVPIAGNECFVQDATGAEIVIRNCQWWCWKVAVLDSEQELAPLERAEVLVPLELERPGSSLSWSVLPPQPPQRPPAVSLP
jgi:hypothetical protein